MHKSITMIRVALLISFFFATVSIWANGLQCSQLFQKKFKLHSDKLVHIPTTDSGPGFILPNEKNIGQIRERFMQSSEGIYVSVGTERGFMSAAMTGLKTKVLVLVDRDDKVVLYNLMNKALLALAHDRQDYLHLRLNATFDKIQEAIQSNGFSLSSENLTTLKNPNAWKWWTQNVQQSPTWSAFHQNPNLNSDLSYQNANYLFDVSLFTSISKLAKENRIVVIHENLGSAEFQYKLNQISSITEQKISFFDLSNSWLEGYLGHQNTVTMLASFQQIMTPSTQLVFTYQATDQTQLQKNTVFKYSLFKKSDLGSFQDLNFILGNLARSEPSRTPPSRSRMSRFGDD